MMDLTLPREIPEMAQYRDKPMSLLPFAVYKLVDLDDEEMSALLDNCAADLPPDLKPSFKLAPRASWNGHSLKSVIQYHIELNREQKYDFFYFIAVTSRNWRADGVLLVGLDVVDDADDEEVYKPDKIIMPANEAGNNLTSLQIANVDWDEVKEAFADQQQQQQEQSHAESNSPSQAPGFRDDAPDKQPPAGFYIGIYTNQDVDFEDVLRQIQPAYRQQPREDFICRFEGQLPHSADLVVEACKLHPLRCMTNRHLAKKVLVIADSSDITKVGVLLALIQWDGDVMGKSIAELAEIGEHAPLSSRRLICQTSMIVPNVCDIASGRCRFDGKRG